MYLWLRSLHEKLNRFMLQDDSEKFEEVETAILRQYDINEKSYHQCFWLALPNGRETLVKLMTRFQDLAGKWLKDCNTTEMLLDAAVKEQLLTMLPNDVPVWVKELSARRQSALLKIISRPRRHLSGQDQALKGATRTLSAHCDATVMECLKAA